MARAGTYPSGLLNRVAATPPVVAALALALVWAPGCQRDVADREADGPREADTPTLADLGARRICVACSHDGAAPNGRSLYWTRGSGVMRLDPSRGTSNLVWSDLDLVLPNSGWEEASAPVVSRDGTLLAVAVDDEVWIVDTESGERLWVLSGSSAGIPLDWIPGDRGLVVRNDAGLVSVSLEVETTVVVAPPLVRQGRISPDGRFLA